MGPLKLLSGSSSFVITVGVLLTLLLPIRFVVGVYEQVGLDIIGKDADDRFGYSVSISADGSTFVAGAINNDGNGIDAGHVLVYKYNATVDSYAQFGLDIMGEATFNQFGSSVSISADGSIIVVGAFGNDDNVIGAADDDTTGTDFINSGHVRVYKYDSTDNSYVQVGLDIDGEAAGDEFGTSVSISADGTTFVVGARFNDGNGGLSGHVRVYKYDSTINSYSQFGMDIDGESRFDYFGTSVSISADGTTFVVGAAGNDDNVNNVGSDDPVLNDDRGYIFFDSGHVRVYQYNSTANRYIQLGLDIDGEGEGDGSGGSVSISADGTTIVVGAQYNDGNGINSGHVRVYKYNSTVYSYSQVGVDIDGEAAFNSFGYSVSISADGTTFVVGAILNDDNGADSGQVRVYKYNSNVNRYTQIGSDIDGEAARDEFGSSVSISADGTTFVAGAAGIFTAGYVRVYRESTTTPTSSPSTTPTQQTTFMPSKAPTSEPVPTVDVYKQVGLDINGEADGDLFGYSVSISADGTTFVAGAANNDGNGLDSGNVCVYKYNATVDSYAQIGLDIDGESAGDGFGSSVSISADGSTIVVGATRNDFDVVGAGDDEYINSGHVRVYKYDSTVNSYAQVGLDIDGEAAGDESGYSVSISADGTTFVVGARFNDGNGFNSGHVRVYKYNSTISSYSQFGMDIDGEDRYDVFGSSVSISADGTTFVVGAIKNDGDDDNVGNDAIQFNDDRDDDAFDSGHVRVYKYDNNARRYIQLGLDTDGEAEGDTFDGSVSISADGTTFVVGSQYNDGVSINSGQVRVYKYNSTINGYSQVGVDINGEAARDWLGFSVSISADGTTFVVGAIRNDGNGADSGHVRVYKYNSNVNRYTKIGSDIDGEAARDWLGFSVSISGDGTTFVVGALGYYDNGNEAGYVRVYRDSTTTPTSSPSRPPTKQTTFMPSKAPTTTTPTSNPSSTPTKQTTFMPSKAPTTTTPTSNPSSTPTKQTTFMPSKAPTREPRTRRPTRTPTRAPSTNSPPIKVGVYEQVGLVINGKEANELFGYSVSISADGTTFVAGAINNDGNGVDSGQVRIYNYNSTVDSYVQVGMDINGEAASNQFGFSVSISADGSTFVVGATGNDGNGERSGHVRVYKYDSTVNSYAQVGLDIDGEAAGDESGYSVSISADGTTFVVGARLNDGNGSNSGHVRVYKYNSTINSFAQAGVDIDGEATFDLFGSSVSISADGSTFVVGAVGNDDNVNNVADDDIVRNDDRGYDVFDSGHVRVYKYNYTARRYIQLGLDIDGEAEGDAFGTSVSISADGTTFVVGAQYNDGNGILSGHVRVYKYNSAIYSYSQVGVDINGEAGGDNLGYSVSISADGTTFVVGAILNDGNGADSGHVRVYKYNSIVDSYTQFGSDIDGEVARDWLGFSVSISADGTTFVVGALGFFDNGNEAGYVRVYRDSTMTPTTTTPTSSPSTTPTKQTTFMPSNAPTIEPRTRGPTRTLTRAPSTKSPNSAPRTKRPTRAPRSGRPTTSPNSAPTQAPTQAPTKAPTTSHNSAPTQAPTKAPTASPNSAPTQAPTQAPTKAPTTSPNSAPTQAPTKAATTSPNSALTRSPTRAPLTVPVAVPVSASCPAQVTGYTLVDAERGTDIMPLRSYMMSEVPELLNIRANIRACSPKVVESVLIDWDGVTRCENFAPYTAFGDRSRQDLANNMASYYGRAISAGGHVIKATPYTRDGCEGTAGRTHTLEFSVAKDDAGDDYN